MNTATGGSAARSAATLTIAELVTVSVVWAVTWGGFAALSSLGGHPLSTGAEHQLTEVLGITAVVVALAAAGLRLNRWRISGDQRELRIALALSTFGAWRLGFGLVSRLGGATHTARVGSLVASLGLVATFTFLLAPHGSRSTARAWRRWALPTLAAGTLVGLIAALPGSSLLLAGSDLATTGEADRILSQLACAALWCVVATTFRRDAREGGRADAWSALLFLGLAQSRVAMSLAGPGTLWPILGMALRLEGLLVGVIGLNREMRDEMLAAQLVTHRLLQERRARELTATDRRHDVRASLFAIQSSAMALDDRFDGDDDTRAESIAMFAKAVRAEAARLERLVNEAPPSPAARFDVVEVIEPLVACDRILGQHIDIHSPVSVLAFGCPDATAEALRNLLDNARRHAPGSPVVVTVAAEDDAVRVTVADAGPGIRAAHRDHIFDRGYRGDTPAEGSGIGLASARHLCRAQGGDLVLEPSTGAGAAFTVILTAARRAGVTQQPTADGNVPPAPEVVRS